jgi:hypothetical protein
MGRWREKKDDIFTSVTALAFGHDVRLKHLYQASEGSPSAEHEERSRPGELKISSGPAFPQLSSQALCPQSQESAAQSSNRSRWSHRAVSMPLKTIGAADGLAGERAAGSRRQGQPDARSCRPAAWRWSWKSGRLSRARVRTWPAG